MDAQALRLSVTDRELAETYAHIDRQHEQVRWMAQVYLLGLFGFFSLSGYLWQKTEDPVRLVIGVGSSIAVFALGWLLLAVLAHKISMLMLIHKHLAVLRKHRLELLDSEDQPDCYVFPVEPAEVHFPSLLDSTPDLFATLNFGVLVVGVWFYAAGSHNALVAGIAALTVGAVVGAFYPKSCVDFAKHMASARKATTIPEKRRIELLYDESRKRAAKKRSTLRKVTWGVCAASFIALVVLWILAATRPSVDVRANMFGGAVVAALLFTAARVFHEIAHRFEHLLDDAPGLGRDRARQRDGAA